MDKTKKLIIIFAVALAIAATVLVVTIVSVGNKDKEAGGNSLVYTLQPTTTAPTAYDTESWVDINQIASDLASTTGVSGTDVSVTVTIPGGFMQVYTDAFGNIYDMNGNKLNGNTNDKKPETKPATTIDNQEALDTPSSDDTEMGEYQINEQGIITAYYGDSTSIIIPVTEQGKKVKGIGRNCFKDNNKIKSVSIPDTVTSIGSNAFENCTSLSVVAFGSNVVNKVAIGDSAFKNCLSLREITLPAATSVGMCAFDNCTSLKKVVFSKGTESIGAYCFTNCRSLESVYIPESVSAFGTKIFDGCNQDKLKVYTPLGSDAEKYAEEAGYKTADH